MSKPAVETRVTQRVLADLEPSEVNARKMTAAQMDRLVSNLRHDGALTSAPLVYQDRIISGHHRVEAAIRAGIEKADCIEIVSELSEEHLTGLQLSHNSITGQDDPYILVEMLATLGPAMQEYSAVPPPDFDKIDLAPSIRIPPSVQVVLEFLPSEAEELHAALKRLEKSKAKLQLEPDHKTICSCRRCSR